MFVSPLVSVDWLSDNVIHSAILIVDIRTAETGGRAAFAVSHIPGAIHSDYAVDGWRVAEGGAGGLLPDADYLSSLLGRIGAEPQHHVVIVSAGVSPSDFSAAARVYWTFRAVGHKRVSVLDGGYRSWREDRQSEDAGLSLPRASERYPVRLTPGLRAEIQDVESAIVKSGATLLDGRSQAQFDGHEKSQQAGRAGHLPGALHLDQRRAFQPGTGRLLPVHQLEQLFQDIPPGPVINYCNTGHLASTNWFVLSEVLKRPGVTLYDGSMSEWTQNPNRPVARNGAMA